jgi:hypothetical protein
MAQRSRTKAGTLFALLLTISACSGGGGWEAPDKGQAAVLVGAGADDPKERTAWLGFGDAVDGLAIGPDGTVYGLGTDLVGIDSHRTTHMILDRQGGGQGLVVEPDGTFVTGLGGTVVSLTPSGTTTVLAGADSANGATRKERAPGAPVPATAAAAGYRFGSTGPTPFGERADGTLLLADSDVVWSLKDGRLTRVYQSPAAPAPGKRPVVLPSSAVDGTGTAWIATGDWATVADIMTLAPDGTATRPSLPTKVAGVTEAIGTLGLLWMTSDGKNGVYVHADGEGNEYVLHLRPGSAEMVARHHDTSTDPNSCHLPHPIDATELPCALPYALAYRADRLVLGGFNPYVLELAP